uniref:Uncharacterized protein n=1 Tax=Romanomermis culicivorax TaxID=13658 RepID=A0A915ITR2_ROMCU
MDGCDQALCGQQAYSMAWVELLTPKLTSAEEISAEEAYGHIDISSLNTFSTGDEFNSHAKHMNIF